MNFTFKNILLLCSLCWISVSVSEFNTVEVQSGEDVTLLCSNFTSSPTQIMWFRAIRRLKPISSLFKASEPPKHSDGFQNDKFETTSNMSTISLKVKHVDLSDSGLYFCGFYLQKNIVIVDATYLDVKDMFDVSVKLMSVVLGGLAASLISVIIGLIVKIKKLQKAQSEERNPQQTESRGSDDLDYAVVTFRPNTEGNLRRASEES